MWSCLLDREANLSIFDLMCAPASASPRRAPIWKRAFAQGRKFPGGRKLGSKVVKPTKPASAPARIPGIPLPKQYRHMTFDEFIEASKQVLKQMQERFERTGRLIG